MLDGKVLEIRDKGTFIPVLCVNLGRAAIAQRYLLRRCGYALDGQPIVVMTPARAKGDKANYDPVDWLDRTRSVAHEYITTHWGELADGDVVDVEFILGETLVKKTSEAVTDPI